MLTKCIDLVKCRWSAFNVVLQVRCPWYRRLQHPVTAPFTRSVPVRHSTAIPTEPADWGMRFVEVAWQRQVWLPVLSGTVLRKGAQRPQRLWQFKPGFIGHGVLYKIFYRERPGGELYEDFTDAYEADDVHPVFVRFAESIVAIENVVDLRARSRMYSGFRYAP